jgi:hypothetical protein
MGSRLGGGWVMIDFILFLTTKNPSLEGLQGSTQILILD